MRGTWVGLLSFLVWGCGQVSQGSATVSPGILYPQDSEGREVKGLDGVWEFRPDYDFRGEIGFLQRWWNGPLSKTGETELMPVPSSYNDITQSRKLRDHVGWVWYSRTFWVPSSWVNPDKRVFLRFGSANRYSVLWVNGHHVTNNSGGYLPFCAEVTHLLNAGKENFLVLALNNTLTPETIPQGSLHYPNDPTRYPKDYVQQSLYFDYFNFAGIHRPVFLYTTPTHFIKDISVVTDFIEDEGRVFYDVEPSVSPNSLEGSGLTCEVRIMDENDLQAGENDRGQCNGVISIPKVKLWWPHLSSPVGEKAGYLYTLEVRMGEDVYRLKFGVRTAVVVNSKFYLNKKPFYFRGFGRHEDYSIRGRGVDPVMLVKDHNLLLWTGANSYRTSHYPYAEEILDITDKLGIAVIDESPAIGLTGFSNKLRDSHLEVMRALVQRDKNRPSVVMWSLGNEPKSEEKSAPDYFQAITKETRMIDPQKRPITIVLSYNMSGGRCPDLDVVSINRYFAWYGDTGRIEVIKYQVPTQVEAWWRTCGLPILVTEYGAGSVAGMHQDPSWTWTEDFQVTYLNEHAKAFDALRSNTKHFIGEMVWNFADFATPQETGRPWGCMKGVFTRERQPKAAAHFIRARYHALANASISDT